MLSLYSTERGVYLGNIVFSIIIILLSLFFFYETFNFQITNPRDIGPAFLPRVYSLILLSLGVILLVNKIKKYKTKTIKQQDVRKFNKAILAMFLLFIYILITPYLGFYLGTPIIILTFLWVTGIRNLIILLGVPIGITLLIYLLFYQLLGIPIPTGDLF